MRCPYCKKNTISPIKKIINNNIKCDSCGKNIHFSNSKRRLIVIICSIATYFNNMTEQNPYKSIIFFSLVVIVVLLFLIVPFDIDNLK